MADGETAGIDEEQEEEEEEEEENIDVQSEDGEEEDGEGKSFHIIDLPTFPIMHVTPQ